MVSVDIVSDLHLEQWDPKYTIKHSCGKVKNHPVELESSSDIIVVPGDISDSMEITSTYVKLLSKKYKYVLFVDGNHEHVDQYPYLYTDNNIENILDISCENIFFLRSRHFIKDRTVFIGANGWWDYQNRKGVEESRSYFKKWIPHFKEKENDIFIQEVLKKADNDFDYIELCLHLYENDKNIDRVVVVTHTCPIPHFIEPEEINTTINSAFASIIDNKYKKLSAWIYGHTHRQGDIELNGIRFVCHPRGQKIMTITYNAKNITLP